jgi:hypothetical protein
MLLPKILWIKFSLCAIAVKCSSNVGDSSTISYGILGGVGALVVVLLRHDVTVGEKGVSQGDGTS